jgi:hypothetical protein
MPARQSDRSTRHHFTITIQPIRKTLATALIQPLCRLRPNTLKDI